MTRAGRSIFNPRTGQRMRFLTTGAETGGQLLRMACLTPPHSLRELEHVHPHQENRFAVRRGVLTFWVDGRETRVGPGQRIIIPAGTPHCFWNAAGEPAHYLQEFAPALRIDEFFETVFALARAGKLNRHGKPGFLQLVVLMNRFADEFRPTHPSAATQRLLRCFAPLGFVLGYRADYPADRISPRVRLPSSTITAPPRPHASGPGVLPVAKLKGFHADSSAARGTKDQPGMRRWARA